MIEKLHEYYSCVGFAVQLTRKIDELFSVYQTSCLTTSLPGDQLLALLVKHLTINIVD